ncbi:MAG: hypothetical protein LBL77_00255 [Endomicrobium sp.]|jgi:hypothetical protein|nr:hypothetical protein [Endomicrobium sp.]
MLLNLRIIMMYVCKITFIKIAENCKFFTNTVFYSDTKYKEMAFFSAWCDMFNIIKKAESLGGRNLFHT